jgi:hypothetical protein
MTEQTKAKAGHGIPRFFLTGLCLGLLLGALTYVCALLIRFFSPFVSLIRWVGDVGMIIGWFILLPFGGCWILYRRRFRFRLKNMTSKACILRAASRAAAAACFWLCGSLLTRIHEMLGDLLWDGSLNERIQGIAGFFTELTGYYNFLAVISIMLFVFALVEYAFAPESGDGAAA